MPALQIPPELKKITPFIRRAEELDKDKSSPESRLVAYYLRQYAVLQGIPLSSTSSDAKTCLGTLLEHLEAEKPAMDNFTKEEAAFLCRQFANKIFDKADAEDRSGAANKNTARTFYAAGSFLQILEQFYPEEDEGDDALATERAEDRKRIIYVKWKATEILKAVKEGRTPTPGGYGEDTESDPTNDSTEKKTEDAPTTVETVQEDDDEEEEEETVEVPLPPIQPIDPLPPPPREPSLSPPPPAYPGPNTDDNVSPPPPSYAASAPQPPLQYDLPPPVQPAPLPAPAPATNKGGFLGFGKKKTGGKVSKAQLNDARELTRFALAALEDKNDDLAAQRLQDALRALGR